MVPTNDIGYPATPGLKKAVNRLTQSLDAQERSVPGLRTQSSLNAAIKRATLTAAADDLLAAATAMLAAYDADSDDAEDAAIGALRDAVAKARGESVA